MDKNGSSRLLQMQARFQQKQMAEREMKIASLYEAQQARALDRVRQSPATTGTTVSSTKSPPAHGPVPPGKVRQMFEERRTKGIDKSYPLQPIQNTERNTRRVVTNGHSKVSIKSNLVERKTSRMELTNKTYHTRKQEVREQRKEETTVKKKIDNVSNGAGDLNHNHQPDLNSVKHAPRSNGFADGIDELDNGLNNYRLEDETFPEALAPTPTPRSSRTVEQESVEPKRPPRRSPTLKNNMKVQKATSTEVSPPRRTTSDNNVTTGSKARGVMQRAPKPSPKKISVGPSQVRGRNITAAKSTTVPAAAAEKTGDGVACSVCGRRFAQDRLQRHEEICKKANSSKKRKPFDALKHRLGGTEAEPFINKLRKGASNPPAGNQKPLNNNWRQKHNEFINAIRAAKQVQSHLNAGGKLSDLPPPPPSENPDYVTCPHCNRRFNQGAADRHIPKCASYQFNKSKSQPKPQQPGRRR